MWVLNFYIQEIEQKKIKLFIMYLCHTYCDIYVTHDGIMMVCQKFDRGYASPVKKLTGVIFLTVGRDIILTTDS